MRSARRARLRRAIAVATGVGLVVAGLGLAPVREQPAAAQTASVLSGFDPANIIDDAVMFNGSTMTASQIQAFLNAKQPSCGTGATCLKSVTADMPALPANPMCRALAARRGATAAQIIAAVGAACSVNPQVILVMLQKEQTLVTGRTPYSGESVSLIYRKATGLGCPDTAACDPAKYGLFNQLYGVAYWLVRYTTPPGTTGPGWTSFNWFPVGRPSGVLYNPNATCGAGTITIQNKATASLYYYTPYQPNVAALTAGWGLGDSCSAYGNRNFALYFTTWFGSTHYTVTGPINTYWTARKSTFGDPTGNAVGVSENGGGTYQRFTKGTIYVSGSGTFGVTGAVAAKYDALRGPGGSLGWPRRVATPRKAGIVQGFQKGTIYVSSAGSAAVLAPVYAKYGSMRFEFGGLGWPVSDAVGVSANGGGTVQRFTKGTVYVSASGAFVVDGSISAKYDALGGPGGSLGWPRRVATPRKAGVVQGFQKGTIYVSSAGSAAVLAPVYAKYGSMRFEFGGLGWPVSDAVGVSANGGGTYQRFTKGTVYVSASGAFVVDGSISAKYDALRGPGGSLGWPRRVATPRKAGVVQGFQKGTIYVSSAGSAAVLAPVYAKYGSMRFEFGGLGWPVSDAVGVSANGGGTVQRFTKGTVYVSASGAFVVDGGIAAKYESMRGPGGSLGWPRRVATPRKAGVVQGFQKGTIYVSSAGSAAVLAPVYAKYGSMRFEFGGLGWPVSDAVGVSANGGGTYQRFTKGTVYVSASGAFVVDGGIAAKYESMRGPGGSLGWPRRVATPRKAGVVQGFQKGTIYVSSAGSAAVLAPVYAKYASMGFEFGKLGWPVADAGTSAIPPGTIWQSFQRGRLVVTGS